MKVKKGLMFQEFSFLSGCPQMSGAMCLFKPWVWLVLLLYYKLWIISLSCFWRQSTWSSQCVSGSDSSRPGWAGPDLSSSDVCGFGLSWSGAKVMAGMQAVLVGLIVYFVDEYLSGLSQRLRWSWSPHLHNVSVTVVILMTLSGQTLLLWYMQSLETGNAWVQCSHDIPTQEFRWLDCDHVTRSSFLGSFGLIRLRWLGVSDWTPPGKANLFFLGFALVSVQWVGSELGKNLLVILT